MYKIREHERGKVFIIVVDTRTGRFFYKDKVMEDANVNTYVSFERKE